jgi:glycerol-3-phosphate dehydrogenase
MIRSFSARSRKEILKTMGERRFDLLIIGGGITGAGIALDAASRGMSTALIEMQDFAAGTSSRSTKLVHGGLRYLKQLEVRMVSEVGRERAVVYENGPHVTTPERMLLPFYAGGTMGAISTSLGLLLYDFLAQVKSSERRAMLNVRETIEREPLIRRQGLRGSGSYVEYRTDDARLTIEVLKQAVQQGAVAVNYARAEGLLYSGEAVCGASIRDEITGERLEVRARKVINAAGPWVDTLRESDSSRTRKRLQLTKGIHLVFDQRRFPLKQAIYFDTPDGRMVFAIPREGKTYVGTTDTVYQGSLEHPRMDRSDRQYILDAIRYMFPSLRLTPEDMESSWAGLRPLIYEEGKKASEISRRDEIWQSFSGLITIAGGKLTGYRKMAETVVDLAAKLLRREYGAVFPPCRTRRLPISGGNVGGPDGFDDFVELKAREGIHAGFTVSESEGLVRRYGSNIDRIYELARLHGEKAARYRLSRCDYARLIYSMEEELCAKPVDFFIRRTGAIYFSIAWVHEVKSAVLHCMADYLGWQQEQKLAYAKELEERLREAVEPAE